MKHIYRVVGIFLILLSLFLSSWYVLHGDIYFFTDIARDFLLFQEIDEKKIILIGPRSSATGLFHGPLWLYLNYPAYLIGQGNPIVVGWYWILLIAVFLGGCFFIAKRLFNEFTAFLYVLMLGVYLVFDAKGLFNPFGAFFLTPAMFYFLIKYLEKFRIKYLLLHVITLGGIIHFQMAVGVPLTLLSFLYVLISVAKKKKLSHILAYLVLVIVLSNYLLFDIRHDFLLFKAMLFNISPEGANEKVSFVTVLLDRMRFFADLSLIRDALPPLSYIFSAIFFYFLILQIKTNRHKKIYLLAIYFYAGYIILTLASRNLLLHQQFLPMIPLLFLVFASFSTSRYNKLFFVIFSIAYLITLNNAITYTKQAQGFIGFTPYSWKGLTEVSEKLFEKDNTFGYFLYSPDTFGYQPKYALEYTKKRLDRKNAHYLQKKETTYIVSAPPPEDDPLMTNKWWLKNKVHITKKPKKSTTFPNKYVIEEYVLTKKEQAIPHDPGLDLGLFFR